MAVQTGRRQKNPAAVLIGRRNHVAGQHWEDILEASCEYYRREEIAEIEKTPEPMKQLGAKDRNGRFTACYAKKAQPDYKGTLAGGRAIVFEAKHTETERLQQSVVSADQWERLDRHEALGAACYVLVSFNFRAFFRIPWKAFKEMKLRYGRKYITPEDVKEFEVRYSGGVLQFL